MFRRTERLRPFVAAGFASAALAFSSFPFAAQTSMGNDHAGRAPASSKADAANYAAEIAAGGSYKAGAEGTVTVTVIAKGEYHMNPQYPYKFKTNAPSDGLTYPKPTLQRGDGKFEGIRGTFQVPFVAAKAGKVSVGGILNLSVCSAANCVVDKVPLEIVVEVK
jgi:hypothetical protein